MGRPKNEELKYILNKHPEYNEISVLVETGSCK